MVKRYIGKAWLAAACCAVVTLATPGSALAGDEGKLSSGDVASVLKGSSSFDLSFGETKAVDFSDVDSGQSIKITAEKESGMNLWDASNTAPTCVSARQEGTSIKVKNNCPTPVRVKVVMTGLVGSKDLSCRGVEPGAEETVAHFRVPIVNSIDRVENC